MLQEEKEIENEIITRSEKSQRSKDSHTWTDDKTETFTESGNKRKKIHRKGRGKWQKFRSECYIGWMRWHRQDETRG